MSKRQKRLQKIRQNINNVSFNELSQVLADYHVVLDRISGSHHVFRYNIAGQNQKLTIPFGRPVKPVYVKRALKILDRIIEEIGKDVDDE